MARKLGPAGESAGRFLDRQLLEAPFDALSAFFCTGRTSLRLEEEISALPSRLSRLWRQRFRLWRVTTTRIGSWMGPIFSCGSNNWGKAFRLEAAPTAPGPAVLRMAFVDALDYDFWATRFGNAGAAAVTAAVPEPPAALLAAAGMGVLRIARRRTARADAA